MQGERRGRYFHILLHPNYAAVRPGSVRFSHSWDELSDGGPLRVFFVSSATSPVAARMSEEVGLTSRAQN